MAVANNGNMSFVCFGGEDWWYHNQAHIDMQLMRRFAKLGTALYVNSIVIQKPKLGQNGKLVQKIVRKAKSIFRGLQETDAGFGVYSPASIPVHHISWLRKVNEKLLRTQLWYANRQLGICEPIVWVACPGACDVAVKMKKSKLVYQRTDRLEEYPNVDNQTISRYDRKLKADADLTVFVNKTLYEQESVQCRKAIYLDHGVDFDMFACAEQNQEVPDEMKEIKKPVVGFFGGIDSHTFDLALIEKVVGLLSEMSFVFVGNASSDCSGLSAKNNVIMLGKKPYEQIPHYGKCFDVAIMPWRQNRWIQACNPIKLKEYLALGKPVVSTPFPELEKYLDVVYQADNAEDFARCIKKAIEENNPDRTAARRKKVENASWDSKAKLVLKTLFEK
ncbi:MAG: glycosyltransferase [Planctomycetes bacterium]|nr:glycosyltransferase [Planctomycetota bacterium]